MTETLTPAEWRALVGSGRVRWTGSRADLAGILLAQLKLCGLPEPVREYRFAPPRRWRFDYAWPERKVAAEYEGLHAAKSRHTTVSGFTADCDKYNAAALDGWRVFRFVAFHVEQGSAVQLLERVLLG